jgi:hypothetical protein
MPIHVSARPAIVINLRANCLSTIYVCFYTRDITRTSQSCIHNEPRCTVAARILCEVVVVAPSAQAATAPNSAIYRSALDERLQPSAPCCATSNAIMSNSYRTSFESTRSPMYTCLSHTVSKMPADALRRPLQDSFSAHHSPSFRTHLQNEYPPEQDQAMGRGT